MKKTIPFLILAVLIVLVSCQNTTHIPNNFEIEENTSKTASSTITPEPKETMTPTVNSDTQTAIVWDATSDAFFLTSKANMIDRKTAVVKTISAKDILCKSGYQINPAQNDLSIIDFYKSDKDSWTILSCINEEDPSKIYTEIINYDNSKHFTFSQDDLNLGPMHFLTVFHIDTKNNVLYLKSRVKTGSGFDPYHYFGNGSDVYRLDLDNGDFKTILPYSSSLFHGQTVFSPDLRLIAFSSSDEPDKISFLDTSTEELVHSITLDGDFTTTGAFLWSENGKQMIFAAGHSGWDEEKNGIALYKLNLNTWAVMKILDSNTLRLVPAYHEYGKSIWLSENTISLIDIFTQDLYKLDIVTGKLSEWTD